MTAEPHSIDQRPLAGASIEPSLTDLVLIVWRRKALVLSAFVLGVVAAVAYVATTPAVYEARAVVQIGIAAQVVDKVVELESPNELVGRLYAEYAMWQGARPYPRLEKVAKISKGGPSRLVEIFGRGHSREEAEAVVREATDKIVARHAALHAQIVSDAETRMDKLYELLANLLRRIGQASGEGGKNAAHDRAVAESALVEFSSPAVLDALKLPDPDLEIIKANPTRIAYDVKAGPYPVWPRKGLLLAGGGFAGGMLGVMLALFLDYVGYLRRRSAEDR